MRQNNLAKQEELHARPLTHGGVAPLERAPANQNPQPMAEQRRAPPTKSTTTPLTRAHSPPRTAARADLKSICRTGARIATPPGGTSNYCTPEELSGDTTHQNTKRWQFQENYVDLLIIYWIACTCDRM